MLKRPSTLAFTAIATLGFGAAMFDTGQALAQADFTACQVTDTGGIDDKSFNETAWRGVKDAEAELGITGRFLESQSETDYEPNLGSLVGGDCDLIVTVGFLLGDATQQFAESHPEQKFSIVDYSYDPAINNVLSQTFATDEAAFLAGYLAAGLSGTGILGTFGGINIPPVTIFMDGFVRGARHYNEAKGTDVQVLGWDPDSQEGLFTNNFDSLDDGRTFAQNLYDEGADIVVPVAGTVGLGSAALADELGPDQLKIIGVDADLYETDPENQHVYLTSIMKRMDVTTLEAIKAAMDGSFAGGELRGTLENGGVDIAPLHDFADAVPAELMAEIEDIRTRIVSGELQVGG